VARLRAQGGEGRDGRVRRQADERAAGRGERRRGRPGGDLARRPPGPDRRLPGRDRVRPAAADHGRGGAQAAGADPGRLPVGARGPRGLAAAGRRAELTGVLAQLEADAPGLAAARERLRSEDALGQLLDRRGRMAELATEDGDVKLDWADGVARALDDGSTLADVETLAASIRSAGVRHLVWAGMGGSVQTIHA